MGHYRRIDMDSVFEWISDMTDLRDIACWAQLELMAAAFGKTELHRDFGLAILCAAFAYDQVFDIILDGMTNSDFINRFVDIRFVDLILRLSRRRCGFSETPEFMDFFDWSAKSGRHGIQPGFSRDAEAKTSKRYRILTVLDSKFPMILLKHYAAFSGSLFSDEPGYVVWLHDRLSKKSRYSPVFGKLLSAMEKDMESRRGVQMFMS